jgi:hypothetical protein
VSTTAVAATTTVETAATSTMEAASAAESTARAASITVRNAATGVTACTAGYVATSAAGITATSIAAASAVSVSATPAVSAAVAEAAAQVIAGVSVEAPVVPRADADKEAAVEPVRTVIAVGGAGIGVIRVIAPLAIRGTVICIISGSNHCRPDADAYSDLGVRRDSSEREYHERCQQNQPELLH